MPFLVDEGRNSEFYPWLQKALPSIIVARTWDDSLRLFKMWAEEPAKVTERHRALLAEWSHWKSHLRNVVKKFVFWA